MTQERPFPKVPPSRAVLIVAAFTMVASLMVWLSIRCDSTLPPGILFVLIVVGMSLFYGYRRCPECRAWLSIRHDYIGNSRRYRLLYDCPRCQIAWDTGHVLDENQSGD